MKRSSKRLWSVLLTLAMLLSIAPVSAYAAGTWWGWLGGDTESYSSGSYDAYYYMLLPSFTQGDDSRDTADFNFVGRGSVAGYIGLPNGQSKNNTIAINAGNKGYMTVPPVNVEQHFSDGNGNSRNITTYPNVVYDDITYVYRGNPGADRELYTYSIEWYRYSSSPGYNIGDNFSVSPSEYDGYTWHVDGYVKLSDKYTVTYRVKFPGRVEYSNVSAEGEPANNAYVVYVNEHSNYTFSQITAPEMVQEREESGPNGTVTYTFDGWYYDEACTSKVADDAPITKDIVVYGKYVIENVSGSSDLNIKVFLDGKEITLSGDESDQNYWKNYITNVTNVPSTADVHVVGVDDNGHLKCTFDYTNFNSADLAITPSSSYVLQGVYGTFIYGMYGWNSPKIESTYWKIDNVQGGSTLTVYLSTPYTVQYHLDGPAAELPTDDDVYVAVKGLDDFTAPDFTGLSSASSVEEKNVGKAGGWVDNRLNYELELKPVPTGYTGWYTTADGDTEHEDSYEGAAIETAAKNSGENTPTIIECFGKTAKVNVTYTITGTEKPEDNTVSNMPENTQVYVGSDVTAGRVPTTTSTTNGDKQGSWSFSGWTTEDKMENVQEDVEFTGSWTFTANTPALSVKKSVVSINNVAQPATGTLTAIAGDVIEYKIVITNTGNVPLAGVQVSDSLWTAGMTINVGGEVEQLTDTAYTIGELAVGGSVTISYNYTVKATDESKVKNTATASADGNVTGSDTVETEVVVYDPVIPPVTPTEPEYKPDGLNTTDHFAYIIGYEDGSVRPNGSITRAEVATIFFRLLTDETREQYWSSTNNYTDVKAGDWFNNAVSTLSRMGILGGYADGTFRPDATITRAEFAKIAVSFFKYKDIASENIFTDVVRGSWYESFVTAAAEIGLIEGYEDGTFRPDASITRAEACTIINRTLGRAPDKGHLLPESEMLTWPDNPESAWYYAQIQEATNSHEYKWLGDIEQWLEKLPERNWAELE